MPDRPDRVVFIDTTEVMAKGKSPVFAGDLRRLAQTCSVVTSTLVLDELAANYARDLREASRRFREASRRCGHHFPADRLPDAAAVRQEFVQHLTGSGVVVLPITVTLADVISADLEGGQPFKKEGSGTGYRDFINWVTFVDHVVGTRATAGSFLSNDKDFRDGDKVHGTLIATAKARGCSADLETMRADDFFKKRLPEPASQVPAVEAQHLQLALENWLSIVEDAEILQAMQLLGPGPGIELKIAGIRDKDVELLRGPEGGAVQMIFRATFDCIVVAHYQMVPSRGWQPSAFPQHQPWVSQRQDVRLEWTVEAPFDEKRGITGIPTQVAPLRRLDTATGKPLD